MHKPKPINIASYAVLAIAFTLMVYGAWLAFYPFKVIEVSPEPYLLESTEVVAGESIKYHIDYCRYTDVDSNVTHELISGINRTRIPEGEVTNIQSDGLRLREGCGAIVKEVYIPERIAPGEYVLRETVSYQINPLQLAVFEFETEEFTVTK